MILSIYPDCEIATFTTNWPFSVPSVALDFRLPKVCLPVFLQYLLEESFNFCGKFWEVKTNHELITKPYVCEQVDLRAVSFCH